MRRRLRRRSRRLARFSSSAVSSRDSRTVDVSRFFSLFLFLLPCFFSLFLAAARLILPGSGRRQSNLTIIDLFLAVRGGNSPVLSDTGLRQGYRPVAGSPYTGLAGIPVHTARTGWVQYAVGRERGLIKGSGGKERDATLNQVHARKKPMADDVDYMAVAEMTDGMVGAELANIVEIAAINMMREGRVSLTYFIKLFALVQITTDDLLQAAQIEERGMLERKEKSPEMWKRIALNEAAMAIVAVNFPDLKNIEFVLSITIAPRAGRDLGYVRFKMDPMKFEGMLRYFFLLEPKFLFLSASGLLSWE
ncbi:hypothetical protein GW17_00016013 [Ensete ventricosum]|nr:hypothetical protein GW17_00016013 [Ensete ventricosum]RZR89250.1 hypothetical protein BHM03_00016948 [Ensete ventricosum]